MAGDDRSKVLLGYQAGVLTALTGVFVAKGLSCREEVAGALAFMAGSEADAAASEMLRVASASLLADGGRSKSGSAHSRRFGVILGGKR